jgi:hypothetical protein
MSGLAPSTHGARGEQQCNLYHLTRLEPLPWVRGEAAPPHRKAKNLKNMTVPNAFTKSDIFGAGAAELHFGYL